MINLPEVDQCQDIFNFARIINKYLEDVTLVQKVIIRLRLSPNAEEAELIYQRYCQFKALCGHSTKI